MTERMIRTEIFYSPPLMFDSGDYTTHRMILRDRSKNVPLLHGGAISRYVTVPSDISVYDFLHRLFLNMIPRDDTLILHSVVLYRSHPESGYMIANINEPLLLDQDDRIETFLIQMNQWTHTAKTEIPSELIHIQTSKDVDRLLARYPYTSREHPKAPHPRAKSAPVRKNLVVDVPARDMSRYEPAEDDSMRDYPSPTKQPTKAAPTTQPTKGTRSFRPRDENPVPFKLFHKTSRIFGKIKQRKRQKTNRKKI